MSTQKIEAPLHIFNYKVPVNPITPAGTADPSYVVKVREDPIVQRTTGFGVPICFEGENITVISIDGKFYIAASIDINIKPGRETPEFKFTNLTEINAPGLAEYAAETIHKGEFTADERSKLYIVDSAPETEGTQELTKGFDIDTPLYNNHELKYAVGISLKAEANGVLYATMKVGITDLNLSFKRAVIENTVGVKDDISYRSYFGEPPAEKEEDLDNRLKLVEEILIENGIEYKPL